MEYEVSKAKLKDYAAKLMFDMDDSEYETLQEEFRTILKQMDLIEIFLILRMFSQCLFHL